LGELPYTQDGFGPTLEEVRKGLIGKIGENMSFRRFKRVAGGVQIATYLHGTRIGVLVEYEGKDTAAKDVAMHVAAMKPVALTSNDVPADLIEKERSVATAKAAESGKPADIAAKMIDGAVQKYLKEVSLNNQTFVKNDKQTVEQMLKAEATQVKAFTLFVVGEGIDLSGFGFEHLLDGLLVVFDESLVVQGHFFEVLLNGAIDHFGSDVSRLAGLGCLGCGH